VFVPDSLPAPVRSVLDDVRAWTGPDRAAPATAEERAAWLVGLRQLVDAAEAAFLDVLSSFDNHGDGQVLHGAQSTGAWLQGAAHLAPGDASERVRIARAGRCLLRGPVAALAAGGVTYDQVRAIERSVRPLPDGVRAEAVGVLTDLAQRVDAGRVRTAGRALRHTVDPDGALDDARDQFDRRYLTLSPLLDGLTALDGLLDAEATAMLTAALAPFGVPSDPDDRRSAAQRRVDGLVEIAALAMKSERLPTVSGAPARLELLVPLDALADPSRGVPGTVSGTPGGPGLLTPVTVRRLGCDAVVSRVVLGPGCVPVDLGRAQRLFSPAQRRALSVRDGGCRFPGCSRPPRYTDAHHRVSWTQGGATDLTNGLLLCRYHHRLVHEGGWSVTEDDPVAGANARLWFRGPHNQCLSSDPRGP
jgi:hypothetical protein